MLISTWSREVVAGGNLIFCGGTVLSTPFMKLEVRDLEDRDRMLDSALGTDSADDGCMFVRVNDN
jgi:hypothetical protein